MQPGVIWAGTNDGLVQVTRDARQDVDERHREHSRHPDVGFGATRRAVADTPRAAAYIIVDAHQENNRDPWVYKTNDFGKTWKLIVTGIPKSMLSYAHIIREDPVRRGLLYLGTENALYVSFDDGDHWQPHAARHAARAGLWLSHSGALQRSRRRDVRARLLHSRRPHAAAEADAGRSSPRPRTLFAPRPAYRFRDIAGNVAPSDDPTAGSESDRTARSINYWLKSARRERATIAILDAAGKTVRTLRGTATGRAQSRLLGSAKRADEDAAHAHQADVRCRVHDGRRRHAAARPASARSPC